MTFCAIGCPADATCLLGPPGMLISVQVYGMYREHLVIGPIASSCCRSRLQVACKDQRIPQLDSKWKFKLKQGDLWGRHAISRAESEHKNRACSSASQTLLQCKANIMNSASPCPLNIICMRVMCKVHSTLHKSGNRTLYFSSLLEFVQVVLCGCFYSL